MDKSIFQIEEDFILGILYIPPAQSRFLNEDEYLNLEMEITSMCCQSSFVCLSGDMNARTSELCDFTTADKTIADIFKFDQDTINFFNQSDELSKLNINLKRISQDKNTNNNGYRLIDICINNNLFILNGRFGMDKNEGKCTFRNQSLIDYTICSVACLKLLSNFEVIITDSLYSDGHALLKWSFTTMPHLACTPKQTLNKSKPYKKWDSRKADTYASTFPVQLVNDLSSDLQPTKISINNVTNSLARAMTETARICFPVKQPKYNNPNDKPWFGPQCRDARKNYMQARKDFKRLRNNQAYLRLQQSSKNYKKVMNFHISKYKYKNANKLRNMHSSKPKDFWHYLNSIKRQTKTSSPPLQTFYDYFKNINTSEDNTDFDFHNSKFNIEDSNQMLNENISESEISLAIRGLKSGKAAGHDEIINEYINSTAPTLLPLYMKLFNTIFDSGILPESWLEGKICPIYKNKGAQSDPENYRPITVLSCLSKLFTSILNNRLTHFLDAFDLLNENQAGFRKGYSTTDHIFTLNALIELFKAKKKKLYCAFIDFSKAFDSVWRIGLWRKLLDTSVNGKFFRLVHNMYEGIKSSVSINGNNSAFFACDCGVRQGENLSPLLFSIYLNDLESYLLHKGLSGITVDINDDDIMIYLRIFTLLYADDTVLMADSPEELQSCLAHFATYCQEWKLNINIEKTKILIFGARKRPSLQFNINNTNIEVVDKYKYLGIFFSQSGSFLNARKHIVQQAKKAMTLLFIRINNLDIPVDLQLKLFDHTVLPILTYASEVWGYEKLDMVEKVHNDFLRKITMARKSTPLYMIYGELGRYPLEIIVKSRIVGFWRRIIQSNDFKLSLLLYQCLLHSGTNFSKWIQFTKNIFNQIGRPDIWTLQQNSHPQSLSRFAKKILIDQFIQSWQGQGAQSTKALIYFNFKQNFGLEKYFTAMPRKFDILFFKVRTSNHKLPIETGRWDGTEIHDRKCNLCTLNDIGDEFHYVCKCPYFAEERRKFIKPYYINRPNMLKFVELLKSNKIKTIKKLCLFMEIVFRQFH
ncbi:MAG: reverse transcriptase family protein [Candidatus Thiodiazotropha taylori]|nr:reverse transcriptase family protein [Candidatus Thiodiazotropha taylori]MCW4335537.1 reverse transcriptase family protein [Candidatus Thiodiazotropha endolucinida]